ncbi:MAG TPA: hypothetical protein VEW45_08020 [Candidatus Dormibacteraeota bacterium]|nr:hypothetical protein [Candidatus Dormibacteraeota bacterium]
MERADHALAGSRNSRRHGRLVPSSVGDDVWTLEDVAALLS